MKLSDLAKEIKLPFNPKKSTEELLYIGLDHILPNTLHLNSYSYSNDTESLKYRFNQGDILFGTMRPYFKKLIKASFNGVCSTEVSVIRSKQKMDNNYVFYLLAQDNFIKFCNVNSKGDRPRTKWKYFSKFRVNHNKELNRVIIGEILSSYDDLIDTNRRRIQLLEESARLLYREWFVYFRFPLRLRSGQAGHEKVKLIDYKGIHIPEGWEYLPITKIKILKKTSVGVPVFVDTRQYYQTSEIDGTNLTGSGEEVDYENRPSRASVKPRLNAVYFARMKDTAKVLYFNKSNSDLLEKILLSTGMAGFATNEKYLAFLFGLLTSYEFVQNKNNYATGATQVSLSDSGLRKIKVLFPALDLIKRYSETINPLLEECSILRKQNQKLAQARDLLLPRLMSGKIEV